MEGRGLKGAQEKGQRGVQLLVGSGSSGHGHQDVNEQRDIVFPIVPFLVPFPSLLPVLCLAVRLVGGGGPPQEPSSCVPHYVRA